MSRMTSRLTVFRGANTSDNDRRALMEAETSVPEVSGYTVGRADLPGSLPSSADCQDRTVLGVRLQ
eukprot:699063-Hanusia_phi.AAC.1